MRAHFILYVSDQNAATAFYATVLAMPPRLDVPGMTEFDLDSAVLGLMPQTGIRRLIGEALPDLCVRALMAAAVRSPESDRS